MTEATIDAAETALFQAKVPASDPKYLVVDSHTYSQIRQIPRFSEFHTAGEAGLRALVEGNVGKIKDFFVFRSQFVQKTGSTPVNTHNLAFSKDAIGSGGSAASAASAGNRRHCRIRRNGQLRNSRGDELSAEYSVPAVHGGRALRLRRSPEQLRRSSEQLIQHCCGACAQKSSAPFSSSISVEFEARDRRTALRERGRYGSTTVLPEDTRN